jgi:hypothetical protein
VQQQIVSVPDPKKICGSDGSGFNPQNVLHVQMEKSEFSDLRKMLGGWRGGHGWTTAAEPGHEMECVTGRGQERRSLENSNDIFIRSVVVQYRYSCFKRRCRKIDSNYFRFPEWHYYTVYRVPVPVRYKLSYRHFHGRMQS